MALDWTLVYMYVHGNFLKHSPETMFYMSFLGDWQKYGTCTDSFIQDNNG